MATYVLVHGAWHTGDLLADTAAPIRAAGHEVHTPTLAGNRPGDAKTSGLDAAIASLVAYFDQHQITDAVVKGHSYGGMVITGACDRLSPGRIKRLVYWNAFVPNHGESIDDMSRRIMWRCSTKSLPLTGLSCFHFPFGGKPSSTMPTRKRLKCPMRHSTRIRSAR